MNLYTFKKGAVTCKKLKMIACKHVRQILLVITVVLAKHMKL